MRPVWHIKGTYLVLNDGTIDLFLALSSLLTSTYRQISPKANCPFLLISQVLLISIVSRENIKIVHHFYNCIRTTVESWNAPF